MRSNETPSNSPRRRERPESPVLKYAEKTKSRISRILERGKEILTGGLKEAFNWALVFGIFSGTVNLILGNPAFFVPYVLQHVGIGAVGGFGVGSVMNLINGKRR